MIFNFGNYDIGSGRVGLRSGKKSENGKWRMDMGWRNLYVTRLIKGPLRDMNDEKIHQIRQGR